MLTIRILPVLFTLALACRVALSDPPTPTPTKNSHPQQEHSAENKNERQTQKPGTDNFPFVIKILPSQITETITKNNPENGEQNAPDYRWLDIVSAIVTAFATAVIAWFTVSLSRSTKKMWGTSNQSIDLARQEFISTHRPKIILREAFIGSVLEGQQIGVDLVLANVGETAGFITKSWVNIEIVNESCERLFLQSSVEAYEHLGRHILAPGEQKIIPFPNSTPKWEAEKFRPPNVKVAPFSIHLVGQFIYQDTAGIKRRTAFRRVLRPARQRFYRIKYEPDLDYAD